MAKHLSAGCHGNVPPKKYLCFHLDSPPFPRKHWRPEECDPSLDGTPQHLAVHGHLGGCSLPPPRSPSWDQVISQGTQGRGIPAHPSFPPAAESLSGTQAQGWRAALAPAPTQQMVNPPLCDGVLCYYFVGLLFQSTVPPSPSPSSCRVLSPPSPRRRGAGSSSEHQR